MDEIKIESMFIRLDQLLKYISVASSGGEAKVMILDGMIKVNGKTELQRGKKIKPGDIVTFKNKQYLIK
ncbi:MAG: RNA-binding S4 domain-containing protein [Tissierellales bacterium]|nr:RNA-binding S4 domain-containing protein [Tissierellales bacterium]MBN2827201.1 RNA-binding S4 domain-containing protein [Tissierellales bacterium]